MNLNRADVGGIYPLSMEPAVMDHLVVETERARHALRHVRYGPTEAESKSNQYRHSLYVVHDLKAGEVLSKDNVREIRPGLGLPTKYLEVVMGKTVSRDVKRGTALSWGIIG